LSKEQVRAANSGKFDFHYQIANLPGHGMNFKILAFSPKDRMYSRREVVLLEINTRRVHWAMPGPPCRRNQRLHLPILTFAWLSVRQHRSKNKVRVRKAKLNIFVFRKD
jgi:hypothetical protein